MRLATAALVLGITACSPYGGGGAFHCEMDAQCTGAGPGARCEPTSGFCSFSDPECGSGQRYGSSSGGLSGACVADEPAVDARVDALDAPMIDGPPGALCLGTPLRVCLTTTPTQPVALPAAIDTMSGCTQIVMQASGPELCVVAGTTVTVPGATRATGPRPLVVVATQALTVEGTIDASSSAAAAGAGANATQCAAAGTGADDTGGGGGGAGASFGAKGGDGGRGDENDNGAPNGKAAGGVATAAQTPDAVRGGCKGGNGGDAGAGRGTGGNGGGAVYLIAGTSITIATNGGVYAAGAGGGAGPACGGGGGGGSGGMVGLDAPTITITGKVAANGGGGGGGGSSGTAAGAGGDGTTTMWNTRAAAGTSPGGNGVAGGQGSALGNLTGQNGPNGDCGGGAGGGGVGAVWTHGTVTGTQVSPAPTAK